jgi:mannose-6-phosphate isomerase-like protein (cupin superfamily)
MNTPRFKVLRPGEGSQFSVFGSALTYMATAEDTRGAFSLALETTSPHSGFPLHVQRREDEAMYILEGEYEIECGDQVFRAGAGTFVFLPKDIPNRYQNLGNTPAKFLYITSPGGFEQLVQEINLVLSGANPDMLRVKNAAREHGIDFV